MEPLGGLHHVTAVTGRAADNVRFYTETLGLRLVKKTVNQDDVSAYHLFYADARANPGTDVTFFDWPWAVVDRPGVPEIAPIALRVGSGEALDHWEQRLGERAVQTTRDGDRLHFRDPEGQRLALVPDGGAPGGEPWSGTDVPEPFQLKGLHGVTLRSHRAQATADVLTQALGFRLAGEREHPDGGREYAFEVGPGGPGTEVRLHLPKEPVRAALGRGGVHHVAFRVPDDAAHAAWRERVESAGLEVTPVIDRFYFKSIYFREPGGNLFEIATDGPGFTADEPLAELGQHLSLPPFLEPRRAEIEANLVPL